MLERLEKDYKKNRECWSFMGILIHLILFSNPNVCVWILIPAFRSDLWSKLRPGLHLCFLHRPEPRCRYLHINYHKFYVFKKKWPVSWSNCFCICKYLCRNLKVCCMQYFSNDFIPFHTSYFKNENVLSGLTPLQFVLIQNLSTLLSCIKLMLNFFLTISYLFSIPKKCPDLKFHCSFEVLHLKKLEKIFFQVGKKIVLLGKIFFLVGKNIFSIFPHEKTGKVKKIFCYHNCPDLSLFE